VYWLGQPRDNTDIPLQLYYNLHWRQQLQFSCGEWNDPADKLWHIIMPTIFPEFDGSKIWWHMVSEPYRHEHIRYGIRPKSSREIWKGWQ
jgi:hypothetical protein